MGEGIADKGFCRYLIHDRESIFARHFDYTVRALSLKVLRTPFRSPRTNSMCERAIGTIGRECLDWIIAVSENQLRVAPAGLGGALRLGKATQEPLSGNTRSPVVGSTTFPAPEARDRLPAGALVHAKSMLGHSVTRFTLIRSSCRDFRCATTAQTR